MAGATIGGLDLGRLKARLDLADGILELADLRGRMVDRPGGGGRPPATEPPPAEGPLPRGGFRGRVRAELVGQRRSELEMEGVELPIAELINVEPAMVPPSAPTVRGLPIAGRLTIQASAGAEGSDLSGPGHLERSPATPRCRGLRIARPSPATSRRRSPSSRPAGAHGHGRRGWRCPASGAGSGSSWPSPGLMRAS